MTKDAPVVNSVWQHITNGENYIVFSISKGAGSLNGKSLVIYRNIKTKEIYVRDVEEWHLNFIEDKTILVV